MNLRRVVFALAVCVGLVACGEDADDVPPPEKRQVSVLVMDTSAAENPVLKFRAEDAALSDVLKKVGPLTKSQTIALRCEGGYTSSRRCIPSTSTSSVATVARLRTCWALWTRRPCTRSA